MDFAMGWNRFHLSILGTWPEPRETWRNTKLILNLMFWISTLDMIFFLCGPQIAYVLLRFHRLGLDQTIENLSTTVPIVFALMKHLILRYHKDVLTPLLGQLFNDWKYTIAEEDRNMMLQKAKISRMMSIVSSVLTYVMITCFFSLQIWTNMSSDSETELGGLLHATLFPYDIHKSPNFEITWILQCIATLLNALGYAAFDTFFAALVVHLCGQLAVLRKALENLVVTNKIDNTVDFQKQLGFIVYRHNELSRFADTIETCFNLPLLIQTLISTSMFCLTGYRLMTSVNQELQEGIPMVGMAFFLCHMLYTMLHIFFCCYVGESLLGESTGVAESAYFCKWYKLPPKQASPLVNVIARGRIPFQVTAGKFSPFSMQLFNAILRTAAGYLSVLLAVKDSPVEEQPDR